MKHIARQMASKEHIDVFQYWLLGSFFYSIEPTSEVVKRIRLRGRRKEVLSPKEIQ